MIMLDYCSNLTTKSNLIGIDFIRLTCNSAVAYFLGHPVLRSLNVADNAVAVWRIREP